MPHEVLTPRPGHSPSLQPGTDPKGLVPPRRPSRADGRRRKAGVYVPGPAVRPPEEI